MKYERTVRFTNRVSILAVGTREFSEALDGDTMERMAFRSEMLR